MTGLDEIVLRFGIQLGASRPVPGQILPPIRPSWLECQWLGRWRATGQGNDDELGRKLDDQIGEAEIFF